MKTLPLMRALLSLLVGLALLTTATAQTATDPNEGSRLTYNSLLGSYSYSWWGQPGRTSFLQHSSDLSVWEYLPLIESGANAPLSWGFTSTASKFFLRLRFSDIPTSDPLTADFDGDKVGNWDELLHGTDPLLSLDTDANGLPDDWETFYFSHLGVVPNATAPGGGMTNQQHFDHGSNPNNPPPPPTITAGSATLDQSADTLLYPANETGLLLQNGNFSTPAIASNKTWDTYPGITGWTALSGTLIELQKINVNTTAGAGQYCELDAHWPTTDHSGAPDHGLQQTVNLPRGHYVLIFDYRARQAGADSFTVKLKPASSSTETLLLTKNAATTTWQRASVPFQVTGGNPNTAALPITLIFDEVGSRNTYGPYLDNVLLLPVEIQARDGKINDGFDPPLSGDKDINNLRDEDDWVPWTRVAKSGTFQVNELTQLVTNSVSVAQILEVVPADDSVEIIEIPTRFPNTASYPLTIKGKAANDKTVFQATVEVRLRNSNPVLVVARMKMLVMPELPQFELAFSFVEDTRYWDDARWSTPRGTLIRDNRGGTNAMVNEASECLKQICVESIHIGPDQDRNVVYMDDPVGGFIAAPLEDQNWNDFLPWKNGQKMIRDFPPALFNRGQQRTVLVHAMEGGVGGAFNPETGLIFMEYDKWYPGDIASVFIYPYWGSGRGGAAGFGVPAGLTPDGLGRVRTRERTFAHELGHALLPVRNRPVPGEVGAPVNGWNGGHDGGPSPTNTDALMRQGGNPSGTGRWMRHEDWKTAFERLKVKMGIP